MAEEPSLLLPGALFGLLSIAAIWPPEEFVAAGLTFEHLFWFYLGKYSQNVFEYQIRKIVINRACVVCLPILFALYICVNHGLSAALSPVCSLCWAMFIPGFVYAAFHILTDFRLLRQTKQLELYDGGLAWKLYSINADYIDMANFNVSFAHSNRIVVGQTWVIHITRFDFNIIALVDVSFEAVKSTTVELNLLHPNDHLQFIVIEAKVQPRGFDNFTFRILSDQLRDLQDRVHAPIRFTRNVILKQSLNERFVKVFMDMIDRNPRFIYPSIADLEPCFGCSQEHPNVKIIKRCVIQIEGMPECRQCMCRPMWCVGCLGRIFASKQYQDRPDFWLDGQASCPTCRAEFCMLDVSFVVANESQIPEYARTGMEGQDVGEGEEENNENAHEE